MPDFIAPTQPLVADPLPLVPRPRPRRRAAGRPGRRPLPDPAAVRPVAVPESAPPYDDALPELNGSAWRIAPAGTATPPGAIHDNAIPRRATPPSANPVGAAPGGETLGSAIAGSATAGSAIAGSATAGSATAPGAAPGSMAAPAGARDRDAASPGYRPTTDHGAGAWPSQFAQVLAETLAGSRPPRQINTWTTEEARKRIDQLGPLMASTVRPRVRRVIITSPTAHVLEMTVIVGVGPRVRAVAVRMERIASQPRHTPCTTPVRAASRWVCTAIDAA